MECYYFFFFFFPFRDSSYISCAFNFVPIICRLEQIPTITRQVLLARSHQVIDLAKVLPAQATLCRLRLQTRLRLAEISMYRPETCMQETCSEMHIYLSQCDLDRRDLWGTKVKKVSRVTFKFPLPFYQFICLKLKFLFFICYENFSFVTNLKINVKYALENSGVFLHPGFTFDKVLLISWFDYR